MPDPPPPLPRAAPRALRVVARVALWGLVALAALGTLRGAVPARPGPPAAARPDDGHGAAAGVAAAFLREYLTAGDGQAERHARLAPFLAAGVDLDDAVRVGPGEAQYVDQVLPAGARPTGGTLEVTVLAHVLEVRAGRYRHGGTLAFAVPVAAGPGGFGVRGTPRPAALPVGTLAVASRVAPPPGLGRPAGEVAEQAVAALLAGDRDGLDRLGGGVLPEARTLPAGWRAGGTAGYRVTGHADALVAEVLVRASAPAGGATYLVPVSVWLAKGPRGLVVRRVDAGGPVP